MDRAAADLDQRNSIDLAVAKIESDDVVVLLSACSACSADLNDDGSVGASDLLSLLTDWGPCKGCPTDFDDNGNVGASDLLALLANLGRVRKKEGIEASVASRRVPAREPRCQSVPTPARAA